MSTHHLDMPKPIRRQTALVLFVFVALAFVLLAFRSELNANSIRHAVNDGVRSRIAQCQVANRNAASLNTLIDSLITAVGKTPSLPAAEKARRIATYRDARASLVTCEKR